MTKSLQTLTASIVPFARLGTALSASRTRNGSSLAGLARSSRRRYLPDDLAEIERGERTLDEDQIIDLAQLYRMQARQFAAESPFVLQLDGSTTQEFGGKAATYVGVETIVHRLVLILDALGDSVRLDDLDTQPLSQAFGFDDESVATLAEGFAERASAGVGAEDFAARSVVPEVGMSLGETPLGNLSLVRARCGRGTSKVMVPSACRLGELGSYLTL